MNWIDIRREALFLISKKSIVALLIIATLLSIFSVWTGSVEIAQQRATIQRLIDADELDRKAVTEQYHDYGYIAYYTFHLTYAPPSPLAFAALGVRDVYPWKHRIRMLALEGQIHESDTQNPELALAGKIDFTFVVAVFSPLLLLLLLHDMRASERAASRYDFLMVTRRHRYNLWPLRAGITVALLWLALIIPFIAGALFNGVTVGLIILVSLTVAAYLSGWAVLCYWVSRIHASAPVLASLILGAWLLTTFIIPSAGNVIIDKYYNGPHGGAVLMTQREAVNDAWDLPHETTMAAFLENHPQWAGKTDTNSLFEWKWYYAFQQVGDEKVQPLAEAYQQTAKDRYETAGWVALLSPATLLQRQLTQWADTDATAAWQYNDKVRSFHAELRHFYYPLLFNDKDFEKAALQKRPEFDTVKKSDE
ncbi:DUF3526 domain-containing protein [Salinimonas sp. HHU 13199]|uniref:DUF3526 domain-containing protein n=1 Tax=Salinimonas profundi TaxID=2729140 RepID=A0ABR8LNL9_9ALTE|nr:DUF3526 domain-containing protein [Salinimonas profundi]MBD3586920.1 DUF3526 domain-containing protein [Salinimonas profundi]